MAEFLAGFGDDRGVNDRQHLLNVVEKQAVKKNLVGVLQLAEVDVTLEIVVLTEISFASANGLFFNGFDHRREQAVQAEGLSLLMGEGGAFVQ